MPGTAPLVSVIVPAYNDGARLALCLELLLAQSIADQAEIIVIDNGSSEDLAPLHERYPMVRWLHEATPGSYAARNTGITVARGSILAFTDSDCLPSAGWLEHGIAPLLGDDPPSFVGGAIDLVTTGAARLSAAELFDLASGFPQKRFVEQVHFAMTANMLTTAKTMAKVGPFATSMKSGGDREWGNRAWAMVGPGHYVSAARIGHPTRSSPAEVLKRVRRVAGGERDRKPGWADCLAFCARQLTPPRRAFLDIAALDPAVAPPVAKASAMLFAYRTRLALVRYRLALQFGGESSRS
ncbi:glycosyltransferase [Sphingomonas yantingensis]|uniref:Glycosyltransferase involved in cell wall biosynthesis n=1 Tax=Sphingomonas yantingensis TaxID=1241761 RepID=A0A7W9AS14_9SPHN|nr:glycosyltransferase family 2 protein [Sphingomonas yantingensis]MBB5699304.1 glycosyltransferase involved in cell wall biosynthesis [Sphingomonas yantingensis]